MTIPAFWRTLANDFEAAHKVSDFTVYRSYYQGRSSGPPYWQLPIGSPKISAEFEALATRAAMNLATPTETNLVQVWLEALWTEATTGPVRQGIDVLERNEITGLMHLRGKIENTFRASSILCSKFEAEALRAEFSQRKHDELMARIVRDRGNIREVASDKNKRKNAPSSDAMQTEPIAQQIQRLREECRWEIETLAEMVDLSVRSVGRHLNGKAIPHLRHISAYERVFSKELKRKVVIDKMS
jgi:ribosome-binding protein aMBF1 (putative translation factor)